jgi:hypothetical protein
MDCRVVANVDLVALERRLGSGKEAQRVVAAHGDSLCFALGERLVLLALGANGAAEYQAVDDAELRGDVVSCVEFLEASFEDQPRRVAQRSLGAFVCGTRGGWLRWFATDGRLLLSHRLHDAPVTRIRGPVVLYARGVAVLLDGEAVLRSVRGAMRPAVSPPPPPAALSYHKFELVGQRVVNDVVACGSIESADPWSAFETGRAQQQLLCGGAFPMLGLYVPQEHHGRLSTAVAMASELTSKLTSAVFSMAKSWWASGNEGAAVSPVKAPRLEEPRALELGWQLGDASREVLTVVAAPGGSRLAAACDGLGRVLLLDLELQIVVRMWKGYREAQVAWIEQDDVLFLVVYAPRRGVLEVWRMRHGQREALLDVGTDCLLLPGGRYCHLLRPSGQLQRLEYSAELGEHLRNDQAVLERIRTRQDDSVVQLVGQMRHPKLLVQAVLALSKRDPAALFLEVVTAALAQCGSASTQPPAMLTPGDATTRVIDPDVTHLVWLDRFIRGYLALEAEQPPLSCRQFLGCFRVQSPSEARLTVGMTPEKRVLLGQFFFLAPRDYECVQEALRWTRLARSEAEALLADCLLQGPSPLEREAVRSLGRERTLEASPVVLPVLLRCVCECCEVASAARVAAVVLEAFPTTGEWRETQERLSLLAAVPQSPLWPCPSVATALDGGFSVFKVFAALQQTQAQSDYEKMASAFPVHAAQSGLLAAHVCLEQLSAWSADVAGATSSMLNATLDDETGGDAGGGAGDSEEEGAPTSGHARLLTAAANVFLGGSGGGALALHAWNAHLAPLFWRCASLVELARKTPSEHVVAKTLLLADVSELRQVCTVARDCLRAVLQAWDQPAEDDEESTLPFPSHPDAAFTALHRVWRQRQPQQAEELRLVHLLARAVCAVLKYGLRGVNVACVLPRDTPVRANLTTSKSRYGSVELLRRVLVLKLLPANNKLAVTFSKTLGVDLAEVRKMAAAQVQ